MINQLVSPAVWQAEMLHCKFGAVEPRLATAILGSLQDAHTGITPRLAEELARVITRPAGRKGVWARVMSTLVDSLSDAPMTEEKAGPRESASAFGLYSGANRILTILQIARPLILEACADCGKSFLLCLDEKRGTVSASEYRKYDAELEKAIAKASEKAHGNRFFRYVQANTLSSFSRDTGGFAAKTSLPEIDPVGAAVLLALKPELPLAAWHPARPPKLSLAPRNRPSRGAREESVEGIRFSHREEDLGSILLSEFLHPEILLLERLTSRFLIHERRPRHQKLRHVTVIGIMPHQVRASRAGTFLKACWFDCMSRFGLELANHGLYQSEFRWVEGDAFDRVRDCSFLLEDLAQLGKGLVMSERYRSQFLTALRWLPDYLDTRADFRMAPLTGEAVTDWALGAWRDQRDNRRWKEEIAADRWDDGNPDDAPKLRVSRFSFVHVMVFLPADFVSRDVQSGAGDNPLPHLMGRLYAEFGLANEARRNLSITVVPQFAADPGWKFCARNGLHEALGRESDGDLQKLAGEIERAWLNQLFQEVWRG